MVFENRTKRLPAARLAELLAELLATLPGESRVQVNSAGNLLVLSPDGAPIAFVNFAGEGSIESLGEE